MIKYDHSQPIFFATREEELEAMDLGIKRFIMWDADCENGKGCIAREAVVTCFYYESCWDELLANSIPWPELKRKLLKPKYRIKL